MRAVYKKHTLPDPQTDGKTYTDYQLLHSVEFCCDDLRNYFKSSGWNHEKGKFVIVDQISYEGHSVRSIDFCPFCGEKIEYEDEDKTDKKHQRSTQKKS